MYTRTATHNGELVYKSSQLSSITRSAPISESDCLCYLYAKTDEQRHDCIIYSMSHY